MRKRTYLLLGTIAGALLTIGRRTMKNSQSSDATSGASERPSDKNMYGDFGQISPEQAAEIEDLQATGSIDTTLDIERKDPEWLAKATEMTSAVSDNTYVKLESGVLTVNQLNAFLKSMPFELTFVDSNNQFLYFNQTKHPEDMHVPRELSEVGNPLGGSHPDMVQNYVAWVVHQLRTGQKDMIPIVIPSENNDEMVVHFYRSMYDDNGEYLGINQYVLDILPIVNFYLDHTNQKLTSQ